MRKRTHEEIARDRHSAEELQSIERFPIYVLVDNVRSLYNVGSIFRTSDAARIAKLFLCGYTPHPPRREIEKTALGATKTVPWEYAPKAMDLIPRIKDEGIRICVLEHTNESRSYSSVRQEEFPVCLVVGNEITGVSRELIAAADMAIEIPMYGMKQSLNVAVAYGIAVFELARILQNGQPQR